MNIVTKESKDLVKVRLHTDGVKLACQGSTVLEQLWAMEAKGGELVLCKTCLDHCHLTEQAAAGISGGMPDIIEAMQKAGKVVSL